MINALIQSGEKAAVIELPLDTLSLRYDLSQIGIRTLPKDIPISNDEEQPISVKLFADSDIMTPYGDIRITPDMTEKLLGNGMRTIQIDGTHYADWELLEQPITGQQTDLFDDNLIRMKTEEAPELKETPTMMM